MTLRILDICCGMGGLSLGFQRAGFNIDKGIDKWKTALRSYVKYLKAPGMEQDLSLYTPTLSDFDLIVVGGTPCQDFSIFNKHRDIYSKRSQLLLDFCRIVNRIKPQAFVYENVLSLPSWGEAALMELPDYKVTRNIVDAAFFNVPQRRRRKIFIGSKTKHIELTPSINIQVQTVRDAFAGIPKNWGFTKHSVETSEKFSHVSSPIWVSKEEGSDYQGTIRLKWDSPSCSVVNVKKAQILHPDEDRVITLAEALALQGFPPWYIPEGTDTEKAIQIANAVPPNLAYGIASKIRSVI